MQKAIYPDAPKNKGVKNALLRAKQLAELRWTPVKPFPVIYTSGSSLETHKAFFTPYLPQTGLNYSAVGFTNEKYLGVNVTVETFMTALSNPRSKLYTQPIFEKFRLCGAFYGTVCSEFASYVLGFPFQIDCGQLSDMEEIEHIASEPLENLELCDLLNDPLRHTAVITGIDRDENGKVVAISVTESTPPQIRTKTFFPDEFVKYWLERGYEILRYKKLDKVSYTPNPWIHLDGDPDLERPVPNSAIMPDYGDKANYRLGETVTLCVLDSRYTQVRVEMDGKTVVTLSLSEEGDAVYCPDVPGYYKAYAVNAEGESQPVEYCVTEAAVTTDRTEYKAGEPVRVAFSCAAGDELTGFMVKTTGHSKYRGRMRGEDGTLVDSIALPAGDYYVIGHYRNRFGVYSATPSPIFHVTQN